MIKLKITRFFLVKNFFYNFSKGVKTVEKHKQACSNLRLFYLPLNFCSIKIFVL